jgi:hypothetical protein
MKQLYSVEVTYRVVCLAEDAADAEREAENAAHQEDADDVYARPLTQLPDGWDMDSEPLGRGVSKTIEEYVQEGAAPELVLRNIGEHLEEDPQRVHTAFREAEDHRVASGALGALLSALERDPDAYDDPTLIGVLEVTRARRGSWWQQLYDFVDKRAHDFHRKTLLEPLK